MGLREKVALIIVIITLVQITIISSSRDKAPTKILKQTGKTENTAYPPIMVSLRPHKKGIKSRKRLPDKNQEAILRTFNFPDIEYPTASAPRPPYHLQETNILQRNPVQRAAELPTTTRPLKDNRKYNKKYNNKIPHSKTTKKPGIAVSFPEFGTTPKPYCFREEGAFPDVEYPLSAKDTWKPNYWKPIPSDGFQNQANKNNPENTGSSVKSNTGKTSIKALINQVSKSDLKKTAPNTRQVPNSSSINDSQNNKVTPNQHGTEKSGRNSLITIDVNIPKRTIKKANDQNTTPSSNLSESTKSSTPFVLTPYTTIYFDTTPPPDDKPITTEDETKSKIPTKKKRKKITTKKDESPTRSKKTTLKDTETHPSTPGLRNNENVTPKESISKVNVSKDTCTYMSDDKLTSKYLMTTPYSNHINVTTASPLTVNNDDKKSKKCNDNKVASISDAVNTTVPNNKDKGSSSIEDNVTNSNKSPICDTSNDSPLSSRESDEEFTTDVFPDVDEVMSPVFTVSTSTLPPLSSIEEAWAKSEVIDPYKSLSYPDELEEMYILVP